MEEAKAMGAIALFGEKYGDSVRVVKFGPSVELCGGCHASATGNIGFFKIVSESAIAAGVRRIEAVTGEAAEELVYGFQSTIRDARSFFNNAADLNGAIQKMQEDNAEYKKEIGEYLKEKAKSKAVELVKNAENINGIRLVKLTESQDPALVRDIMALLRKEEKNLAVAAAFEFGGKPQLVLMYSNDLVAKGKDAGKDIREAAKCVLGGGGGQPGLATAGGKDINGLGKALELLVAEAVK